MFKARRCLSTFKIHERGIQDVTTQAKECSNRICGVNVCVTCIHEQLFIFMYIIYFVLMWIIKNDLYIYIYIWMLVYLFRYTCIQRQLKVAR